MEITARAAWTLVHGMGFGALYLLACSGALVELYRFTHSSSPSESTLSQRRFLTVYLLTMVVLAWAAVLTGTYVIYPWYRAVPPPGTIDLSMFPQRVLMSSATTSNWHSLGMEWKEYVAWFAPISITMVAVVFIKYGRDLKNHRQLRPRCSPSLWLRLSRRESPASSARCSISTRRSMGAYDSTERSASWTLQTALHLLSRMAQAQQP